MPYLVHDFTLGSQTNGLSSLGADLCLTPQAFSLFYTETYSVCPFDVCAIAYPVADAKRVDAMSDGENVHGRQRHHIVLTMHTFGSGGTDRVACLLAGGLA